MATSSTRVGTITFAGDVIGSIALTATPNTSTPRPEETVTLASGNNTITVPSSGTAVPNAVTIIPPSGNVVVLKVKGVAGDTGISIHLTDPTTIALATTVTTFVLNASTDVAGIRLIWS